MNADVPAQVRMMRVRGSSNSGVRKAPICSERSRTAAAHSRHRAGCWAISGGDDDGQRLRRDVAGEHQGEEELTPGEQEGDDRGGGDAGQGQRQDDAPEHLHPARPVVRRADRPQRHPGAPGHPETEFDADLFEAVAAELGDVTLGPPGMLPDDF
jgi:hypothetical protein